MSPRSRDISFLLGLAIAGCGAAVDDPNGGGTGDDGNLLDAALDACTPWAKRYADCYNEMYASEDYSLSYVAFVGYCISYFGYAQTIGPACVDAMVEYHACIAALDCEQFFGDGDEGGSGACEAEAEARSNACEVEFESESDSDIPATDAGEFGDESTTDDGESTIGEPPATSTTQTTSASSSSSSDGGGDSTTG